MTIANSIGTTIDRYTTSVGLNLRIYNCTFNTFSLLSSFNNVRTVNCLSSVASSGFSSSYFYNTTYEYWLSHCISMNSSATNYDGWLEGNEGNRANQAVRFVNAASNDYHLAEHDTGARGLGQPGLGADIDGDLRRGPWYDVGADQNAATPTFALPVVKTAMFPDFMSSKQEK